MSTKKTQKAKAKKPSIPPPPEGWQIVSKDDPRLEKLPCRPLLLLGGSWRDSDYQAGDKIRDLCARTLHYALPIAAQSATPQPPAEPASPKIRLRLPSEKPTKEDADRCGNIIVFEGKQVYRETWTYSFSKGVIAWLPGRLPEGLLPKPPTQEEQWRKEFEEWWKSCDGISRNSFASTNEIAMAAFLAAKKSTK